MPSQKEKDARSRAREEAREVLRRVMAGESAPTGKAAAAVTRQVRSVRMGHQKGVPAPWHAGPRKPVKPVLDLYSQGCNPTEISRRLDMHRETVVRYLKDAGVYRPGRSGPSTKDVCKRGHDMAIHGKPTGQGNARYCSECKRMREREGTGEPRTICVRGLHDMETHGRPTGKGNARYCSECKRERDRERWDVRKAKRKERAS